MVDIGGCDPAKVLLAQDQDVIQAFPAKRADEALDVGVGRNSQMHWIGTLRMDVSG